MCDKTNKTKQLVKLPYVITSNNENRLIEKT